MQKFIQNAYKKSMEMRNDIFIARTKLILDTLNKECDSLIALNKIPKTIRDLRLIASQDAVFIEWIFSKFRIGLAIEDNPIDDSWCLLSKQIGQYEYGGQIDYTKIDKLICLFLRHIIEYN